MRADLPSKIMVWARRLGRHYIAVLIGASLLTAASVLAIRSLRFNSDLADLLPASHPDLKALRRIQARYSTDTAFMVLLSKNYVFVSDEQGGVRVHDGHSWRTEPVGVPLHALFGLSTSEVYGAGEGGGLRRFDGTRWSTMESPTRATLRGLWGDAKLGFFAVGDQGTILRLQQGRWIQLPSVTRRNMRAVSGQGNEVLVVGDGGTVLRWAGEESGFREERSGVAARLDSVVAFSTGDAFAVGQGGTFLRRRQGRWERLEGAGSRDLHAIWGYAPNYLQAVGEAGTVIHFDGNKLERRSVGHAVDLLAVHGSQPIDVWAVGNACEVIRHNGQDWIGGPIDAASTRPKRKWYSAILPPQKPACQRRYLAVWRPRADVKGVRPFVPKLAALLAQSPVVSRVEYQRPVSFFKARALYYLSVDDLRKLRDGIEESLQRETAKGTGLYVDLEEESSKKKRQELAEIYQRQEARAAAYGTSEWLEHPDGSSIGMVVFPKQGVSDFENLRKVRDELTRIVESSGYKQQDPMLRFDLGGDGVEKLNEYDSTLYDIFGTVWIPLIGIVLLIGVYFRRPVGLLLCFVPLGMSIAWTAALTSITIGTLNYVTGFLFAVLTGLGIDYGIQLYARYREGRRAGLSPENSMDHVVLDTGRATMTSAITTSAALLTLVVTDFRGFSEFGFIAGLGVLLALASYLLVLPALILLLERLNLLRIKPAMARATTEETAPGEEPFRMPYVVLLASVAMVVVGVLGIPKVSFEYDTRKLRNAPPNDEISRRSNASYGQSFTPTLLVADRRDQLEAAVSAIRRRKEERGEKSKVRSAYSILDLIPTRQPEKRALLDDLDRLLRDKRWNLVDEKTRARVHLSDLRGMTQAQPFGIRDLPDQVRRAVKGPGYGDIWLAMVFVSGDLSNTLEAQRMKAEVGAFPGTPWVNLGNLLPPGDRVVRVEGERAEVSCPALQAGPAAASDQEPDGESSRLVGCLSELRRRLLGLRHQGKPVIARVLGREEAYQEEVAVEGGLQGDVLLLAQPGYLFRAGQGDEPVQPSGTYHVSSGELVLAEAVTLMLHDGKLAFGLAFLTVFLAALLDFRSLKAAILAFLPLLLGFLWIFGLMPLIKLKLNLFNFVILPALLGIGIDYGVHYVHRYREEGPGRLGRVMRSLYWVIFYCAATTVVGFGNVAFAGHPGLKSLGNLAIVGISCIFFAATYTLPALLYALERWTGVRRLAEEGTPSEAMVYGTSYCPSTRLVGRFLTDRGMPHRTVEIDTLPASERKQLAQEIMSVTGRDELPVTRVGDRYVVGFDRDRLGEALQGSGEGGTAGSRD